MLLAIVMHACSSNQTSNVPPATSISACMLIASDFKFTTSNIYFSMHAHSIKFQIYHQQHLFHYRYPHFTRHCRWTDSNRMSNASNIWTLKLLHNKSNGAANLDQLPESGTLAWLWGVWGPRWSVWKCQDLQRVTWTWTHSGMAVGCLGSTVICMEVHFILKKGLALWEDEITFTLFMHFSFIISPSKWLKFSASSAPWEEAS